MEKKIKLEFSLSEDNFKLLENDGYCSIAEVDFLHIGTNRNNCNISKECVEKSLNSFYNKPLLAILNNDFATTLSTDFKEHAKTENEKNKFIAFGTIPESSTFSFITRENGKTYLNAKVVIWKNYFPIIMNILKNKNGKTKVSIELALIKSEQDEDTGILNIFEFRLLSCVVLGENIMEGIEGSHLDVLRFSYEDEIKKANTYYLKFSEKNNSYIIPEVIKNSIALAIGKNLNKKGYTEKELNFAQELINNNSLNKSQLIDFKNYLEKSHSKLTFNLFGGIISKEWLNSIFEESEGEVLMNSLSNNELQDKIWKDLDQYKYKDGDWEGKKYYVEEIYSDEKIAIIRDNETAEFYKVPFSIEKNGDIKIDMENKVKVHKSYEETKEFSKENTVVFSKEDYGKNKSIIVDKSKEAMSDSPWGSVNKTTLRKTTLDAKNYKSLVKDIYMIVEDGWEEAPSSKLKYPVMEIKDGKAVYNRYGLASALAYAQKENETEVISKVKSLYKKLDIDENKEGKGGEKKMAMEEIENKLDKDNEDVKKIKDDVESQEDDVKEEKEKKNACEDVKKNELEKDDSGKEGLEDDADSDKDYWKEKANSLEAKCCELQNAVDKFTREDAERKMSAEIDKFAHCMSDDELKEMKNSIKTCASLDEVKNALNKKIADFALKMKADKKEEKVEYSYNPIFKMNDDTSKETKDILNSYINNSNVKIGK